jgi:hypothetical protein
MAGLSGGKGIPCIKVEVKKQKLEARTAVSVASLFLLLWALSWWLNRSISIFVGDTGVRFIQIRELVANRWQTLAVNYPGHIFDSDLLYVPYYVAYSVVDNEIFFDITPFVPWLASWGYAALGVPGMMLVPVLGGVLTAVAIYRLAQLSRLPQRHLILWLTIFATPLFFYSLELWDHTWAAATAAWSVYWLAKGLVVGQQRWLVLAGMVAGFGLGQRPEMYMFAICLGVGAIWVTGWQWRPILLVMVGGLITAVPIWLWQYNQVGHPLGMALATNLFHYGQPPGEPAVSFSYPWFLIMSRKLFVVEARDPFTFISSLCIITGLILFILSFRIKRWQHPGVWYGAAAIFLVGYILLIIRIMAPTTTTGVLATLPLIIMTLLFVDRSRPKQPVRLAYELVFAVAFLFFLGMLLLWPSFGGLQWGSRYLLPFFPLAVYLAFYNYHIWLATWSDWRVMALRRLMFAVVVISVLLHAGGFYFQLSRHQQTGAVRDGVAALATEVIVTNAPYLPAESASLADATFLYVRDSQALAVLIPRFWEQGVTEFAVVSLEMIPLAVPAEVGELSVREIRPFVYELSEK